MKTKVIDPTEEIHASPHSCAVHGYVVAGGGTLEIGRKYEVRHSRKGTFAMKITGLNGEWITGEIVSGVAKAIMSYNVGYEGDKITIRDSMSYFIPIAT